MRREQMAALAWGVVLTLAAITATLGVLATFGYAGYWAAQVWP